MNKEIRIIHRDTNDDIFLLFPKKGVCAQLFNLVWVTWNYAESQFWSKIDFFSLINMFLTLHYLLPYSMFLGISIFN